MTGGGERFPDEAIAAARDAVKAHLRAAGEDQDGVIEAAAASALALCEGFTGQALIVRAHVDAIEGDGRWHRLAAAPVVAIGTVEVDGAALAAERFGVDIDARGEGWVRVAAGAGRARVTFQAGLATDWASVPPPLAQGVVVLAAHLLNGATQEPPAAVSALWRPWRRMRLRGGGDARG